MSMTTSEVTSHKQNWRTPEGYLMKAVIVRLKKKHGNPKTVVAEFKKLVPDYQSYFPHPLSDNAIAQRADKGTRKGYENEHPDKNPKNKVYWKLTRELVEKGAPINVARCVKKATRQ